MIAYGHSGAMHHPLGDQRRVVRDVEQATGRIVVVTDEIQAVLVGTRDPVAAEREPLFIGADQLPEWCERRRKSRRENDDVEWLVGWCLLVSEDGSRRGESIDGAAHLHEPLANRVHKMKADQRYRVERSVRGTREHGRSTALFDDPTNETDHGFTCLTRKLADVT